MRNAKFRFVVLSLLVAPSTTPANAQWLSGDYQSPGFALEPLYPPAIYSPPRSVVIDQQVVAAPQLPPARVRLMHRRNETLNVEVYDRKLKRPVFQGQLPPGQSVDVTLPRDAGGYVVETYRSYNEWGDVVQRNVTRPLPVGIRYEVVVHQWQIQSIAIDRTGKSPSPIEDINYQGRGLGRFSLPPGAQLRDGQIDVFRSAVAADNPGLVAPLAQPTEHDGPTSDPLRQVIEELGRRKN